MTNRKERRDALDECREALALLRRLDGVHLGTPATSGNIARAEAALGLEFPPSLRLYLAEMGSVTAGHTEVLGLYADEFATDYAANIVGASLLERPWGLPDYCVVVCNPGNGTRVIVDVEHGCNVRTWTPRSGELGDETDPDFGRFLLELACDTEGDEKMARFQERRRAQLARLRDGD